MKALAELLNSISLEVIFRAGYGIADAVGKFLSPVLLIVSMYVRLMETQLGALTGPGKYGTAVRDMMGWGFALGAYYAIGSHVVGFFNAVYGWIDGFGSLKATMDAYEKIMTANSAAVKEQASTMGGLLSVAAWSPAAVASEFIYLVTLILLSAIAAFLRVANALAFNTAFIWGLIAIPMSISTTFKILRGWALLLAFALVWPIIQGLLVGMFGLMFTEAAGKITAMQGTGAIAQASEIMLLFSVMNLLLIAVLICAPLIANALVSNTSAATGIVMPFVAAATAAAMLPFKRSRGGGSSPNPGGQGSAPPAAPPQVPTPRGKAPPAPAPKPTPSAPAPAPAASGGTSAPPPAASAPTPGGSAPAAAPAATPPATAEQQARQQRRGAFVNRARNSRTPGE